MATSKPGEKKLHILQTLASMLENPKEEKITTASLAARIGVSEAALYRHFASKAQMFEGLIEFIESSVFGLINQITSQQDDGMMQAQEIVTMLLGFSSRNPGMTKVMTGYALINEDERLQLRMNQFVDRIELALKQALRNAAVAGQINESEITIRANLIVSVVLGRWQRFVKTSFRNDPLENSAQQIAFLLSR
jgi:TetR/AcrR family transcriptional regulator